MDKERVVEIIKDWIQLDNELKQLQKVSREKREEKKLISSELIDIMKNNEIDCFDVNDGKLLYSKNTVKSSLNKQHILQSLQTIFQNDDNKIEQIANHIFNTREEKVRESIKRKINK